MESVSSASGSGSSGGSSSPSSDSGSSGGSRGSSSSRSSSSQGGSQRGGDGTREATRSQEQGFKRATDRALSASKAGSSDRGNGVAGDYSETSRNDGGQPSPGGSAFERTGSADRTGGDTPSSASSRNGTESSTDVVKTGTDDQVKLGSTDQSQKSDTVAKPSASKIEVNTEDAKMATDKAINDFKAQGRTQEGRDRLARDLTGKERTERSDEQNQKVDAFLKKELGTDGLKDINVETAQTASKADIESGKAKDALQDSAVGAYYRDDQGKDNVVLADKQFGDIGTTNTAQSEIGEVLAARAKDAGIGIAKGDAGTRLSETLNGNGTDSAAYQAAMKESAYDTAKVSKDGQVFDAKAMDQVGSALGNAEGGAVRRNPGEAIDAYLNRLGGIVQGLSDTVNGRVGAGGFEALATEDSNRIGNVVADVENQIADTTNGAQAGAQAELGEQENRPWYQRNLFDGNLFTRAATTALAAGGTIAAGITVANADNFGAAPLAARIGLLAGPGLTANAAMNTVAQEMRNYEDNRGFVYNAVQQVGRGVLTLRRAIGGANNVGGDTQAALNNSNYRINEAAVNARPTVERAFGLEAQTDRERMAAAEFNGGRAPGGANVPGAGANPGSAGDPRWTGDQGQGNPTTRTAGNRGAPSERSESPPRTTPSRSGGNRGTDQQEPFRQPSSGSSSSEQERRPTNAERGRSRSGGNRGEPTPAASPAPRSGPVRRGQSDIRVKSDIETIGHLDDLGIDLYSWTYKNEDSARYVGVMAQDLLARPDLAHAVSTSKDGEFKGFYQVDYQAIGLMMNTEDEWKKHGQGSVIAALVA